MRIEELQCLIAVADHGSIRGAAQQVFMTSQAVGLNIKHLEQEFGVDLLLRTKTGTILTSAGEKVVQFSKKVLQEKELLALELKETEQQKEENDILQLHIGSTSSLINLVFPSILSKKNNRFSLQISMQDSTDDVVKSVRDGTYDIGLITINEKSLLHYQPIFEEELQFNTLLRDELVFVRNRKYCYEGQEYLSSEEFCSNYTAYYNVVPTMDVKTFISKRAIAISNDLIFHKKMLEKTKAIVAMPGLSYHFFFDSKKYAALQLEGVDTPLLHAAIYQKNAPQALCKFADLIRHELYIND